MLGPYPRGQWLRPSSPNCQCFQSGRLHTVSLLSMHAHITKGSNKHTPYATNCSTEMSRPFAAVVDTMVMLQAGDAICAVAGRDYTIFIATYLTDLSPWLLNQQACQVVWPSGLRRWIKAPVSQEAWVRIPPLPVRRLYVQVTVENSLC